MMDEKLPKQEMVSDEAPEPATEEEEGGGGGWGGWGFSPLSVFSDLQKAAEEISRNAAEAAKTALADMQQEVAEDSDSSKEQNEKKESDDEDESEDDEKDKLRKATLDKLGNASEDTIFGQGLKALDSSVENIASGAWQAFGNAWRGGSVFVQKLENSAVTLAGSIQQGGIPSAGSVAPLIESGKAFTAKGLQVLELVGKETVDLLISESGMEVDKDSTKGDKQKEDQLFEEVTFDRCFYIYGGPEQLEELEALSNHYALLFNRKKGKLSSEEKSVYDLKLKQVQQLFSLNSEFEGTGVELGKGKKVESATDSATDEMKSLHDSSVSKAAEMAAGFANALSGLAPNDIIQKTTSRLDSLHSEGVHRLSEMCCFAVSHLSMIGKSMISNANKDENEQDDDLNIDWPEDPVEKGKIIRTKVDSISENVDAISNSFITGISDVAEAYAVAIKGASANSESGQQKSMQDKADTFTENLQADCTTALIKIHDGLQYLTYVVLSTSTPS